MEWFLNSEWSVSDLVGYYALSVGEYLHNYLPTDMTNCQRRCKNLKYHSTDCVFLYTLFGIWLGNVTNIKICGFPRILGACKHLIYQLTSDININKTCVKTCQPESYYLISCSKLMHPLFIIFFHIPLHVSSNIVLIIRRNYCIHTASGSL